MPKSNITFDSQNYNKAIQDRNMGIPISHIQDNRGYFAIRDASNQAKQKASLQLLNELDKGRQSGEEKGWLSSSDVRAYFREKANEK